MIVIEFAILVAATFAACWLALEIKQSRREQRWLERVGR